MRVLVFLAAGSAALIVATSAVNAMTAYKWAKRPLIVFAGSEQDPMLVEQRRMVGANRTALAARDVVVLWVIGNNISANLGARPRTRASGLRSRYGVADGVFGVVLVGKDGGAKLSSTAPISADRVIETIDAMPMRREEMRRR